MLAGELYDSAAAELVAERRRARRLTRLFNQSEETDWKKRADLLAELFGAATDVFIEAGFHCDYGYNIRLGAGVYFNFDCVILDCAPVTFGDAVKCGPGVHIYTAQHPVDAAQRRSGLEFALPVLIGENAWIGGGAVVCPGVSVGANAVIGAGSVLVKDVPPNVVAVGNPCRVVKTLAPTG